MIDTSMWAISIAQGVQAAALGSMAQQAAESAEQTKIANAKASDKGCLFLPTIFNNGEDEILGIGLDKEGDHDIIIYAVNGLYRISTQSDLETKTLFILRYRNSFSKELNCHTLMLRDELVSLFPSGWKVDGQLVSGQLCSFSSDNIDEIQRQEKKLQIERCIAKTEQQMQERIKEITPSAQSQADGLANGLVMGCAILGISSTAFIGVAFTMNQVWWAWLLFALFVAGSIACGIIAKIIGFNKPCDEIIAKDRSMIIMKTELAKYQAELKQYEE